MTIWLGLDAAEYILIPGGTYRFSVTGEEVTVPNLYFAKYPVTNKRYRRFIAYLRAEKGMAEVLQLLPVETFAQSLLASDNEIKDYLGEDPARWAQKLVSRYDDDIRFSGDNQPVVSVSWYAATAYCHWHTMLQVVISKGSDQRMIYRLPTEQEWEWAAGGGKRKYPWGNDKPDETRANYNEKVGKTTPVWSYPAGATPEGLMDMAGNVWEWMENKYAPDGVERALRGGAWLNFPVYLRCVARGNSNPGNRWYSDGFRVVCAREV